MYPDSCRRGQSAKIGVSLSVKRDQNAKNAGLFEAICPTQSFQIRDMVDSQSNLVVVRLEIMVNYSVNYPVNDGSSNKPPDE